MAEVRRFRKGQLQYVWFIAPSILFLVAVTTYPLLQTLKLVFVDTKGLFIGARNLLRAATDPLVPVALSHTGIFVGVGMLFHLGFGVGLALLLNNKELNGALKTVFRTLLLLPWAIAPVVSANVWRLFLHPDLSFLANVLPMRSWNILGRPQTAMAAVIAVNVWSATPFYLVMIMASLQNIPEEIFEAARLESADAFQIFGFITLPLLKPTLLTLVVLDIIFNFGYFDLIWIMTTGGPLSSTEVLATYTYRVAFQHFDLSYGALIAILMFLCMMLLSLVTSRFREK